MYTHYIYIQLGGEGGRREKGEEGEGRREEEEGRKEDGR